MLGLYARVSTDKQNASQQLDYLKDYVKKNNLGKYRSFLDKESGKKNNRKGYLELLRAIRSKEVDSVLVFKLDRISRDFYTLIEFEKLIREYNIKLISLNDTIDLSSPSGLMTYRLISALSAFELETMRVRQKIGICRAQAQGIYKRIKGGVSE